MARAGAEAAFPPALHRELFEHFSFCLPDNEQMLGYPVAGPDNDLRPGHRRYNFVWYRPASEARELPRLLTDDIRPHARALDPAAADRARVIAAMREAARDVLAPQFNAMVGLCEQPFLQPIYDLEVPRMAFGRVAILGDAAFVARPHVGAGVAKAARGCAGARPMRSTANADIEAALKQFEAARLPVGRAHHRARAPSRRLRAGGLARPRPSANTPRATARPKAVLAETAMMDF